MAKIDILGIKFDNPDFVDQKTLKFPANTGISLNVVPGGVWEPNFAAIPQPGTFEEQTVEPESNPILVNKQPTPLASGGRSIKVPGTTIVFSNTA